MKQPCLHCKKSRWLHSPNDYNLPTFASCTEGCWPEDDKCPAMALMQKDVMDLITDNVKKYHAKGRT
jgi:hypothetical protein